MAKRFLFTLDSPTTLKADMTEYMKQRVALVIPMMQEQIENYVNKVIIDKGINRSTELVKWVYSKHGLGFLGWKKSFAEEQIERMKYYIKQSTVVTARRLVLKFQTSNSDLLESILRAPMDRRHLEDGERYTFMENWYEWLTKGYVGDTSYKVLYGPTRGESRIAIMINDKKPELWNIAKENEVVSLKNPTVESFEKNKDKTIARFRKIIVDAANAAFKKK